MISMRAGCACVLWSLLLVGVTACGQVGTQVLSQPDTTSAVVPSITAQPADQSIKAGDAIAGATAAIYTTPAAIPDNDGDAFAVIISNAAGTVASSSARLSVTASAVAPAPAITSEPSDVSITAGQAATFSVVASGTAPLSYQWQKNGTAITGATAAGYTTPAGTTADSGATFAVVVSNSAGSATSRSARLTVGHAVTSGTDVVTYKNDLARTGQNLTESVLTLSNVNATSFGKLRFLSTDGKVDAQPLYITALTVQGATHNVVFVATENVHHAHHRRR
jgi:immunoglobulin I-set domain protein